MDAFYEQAVQCAAEARRLWERGDYQEALTPARRAVLLFAGAPEGSERAHLAERADACRLCGDCLVKASELPEAASVYQEAADLYAQIGGAEAERKADTCAHKLMRTLHTLQGRPEERIYLLIARHERRLRQLELEPGTEREQGDIYFQIARIFGRRDHPVEAVARYREAIRRYTPIPQTSETALVIAESHHRLATHLFHDLHDLDGAARHYRQAIDLYAAHEPVTYGMQSACGLCRQALAEVERRLQERENFPNMPTD